MKCPTSFNTLWEQELRAELWQMHVAVQEAAGGTSTRQKESVREIPAYSNLHGGCFRKGKAARKTRAGFQLRNELSAEYAKQNLRRVDFRRHRGCRHRHLGYRYYHHLGCHHHRRNFDLVRNRNGTAPDSSGPAENKFGVQSMSSVLSTGAKGTDCKSEPGADCKNAAGRHRDCCRGTPASRDSSVAEARKNGCRSNSLDDCYCYSAARCAGRHYSRRNRDGQPRRGDPGGACVRIVGAGSRDDSIRRILSARGPDPLHCPALPKFAS